jgi:hypothetical protein
MFIQVPKHVDFGYNWNKIKGALHGDLPVYAFLLAFFPQKTLLSPNGLKNSL